MIEIFRAGELHSCLCHSSDNTLLSWGGGLTFGDYEFTWITQLQPTNLQDRACRIELADLGLNFPLVKSILLPALVNFGLRLLTGMLDCNGAQGHLSEGRLWLKEGREIKRGRKSSRIFSQMERVFLFSPPFCLRVTGPTPPPFSPQRAGQELFAPP